MRLKPSAAGDRVTHRTESPCVEPTVCGTDVEAVVGVVSKPAPSKGDSKDKATAGHCKM